jgi:hypothetical protein
MSVARLNVWVTAVGDPCRIDTDHQWFVHVLHCEGDILEWPKGNKYINLPTKDAHLELDIPPGCYMVAATWSPGPVSAAPTSLGNHISHLAIVRANCGDHVCVTLFPPTFHWCGIWWLVALREAIARKAVPANAAKPALQAVEKLLEQVPRDPFTEKMMEIVETKPRRAKR